MRNNDIMSEDFNKEIPEPKEPVETPWPLAVAGLVILACILSIIVALTIRLDSWIIH